MKNYNAGLKDQFVQHSASVDEDTDDEESEEEEEEEYESHHTDGE